MWRMLIRTFGDDSERGFCSGGNTRGLQDAPPPLNVPNNEVALKTFSAEDLAALRHFRASIPPYDYLKPGSSGAQRTPFPAPILSTLLIRAAHPTTGSEEDLRDVRDVSKDQVNLYNSDVRARESCLHQFDRAIGNLHLHVVRSCQHWPRMRRLWHQPLRRHRRDVGRYQL